MADEPSTIEAQYWQLRELPVKPTLADADEDERVTVWDATSHRMIVAYRHGLFAMAPGRSGVDQVLGGEPNDYELCEDYSSVVTPDDVPDLRVICVRKTTGEGKTINYLMFRHQGKWWKAFAPTAEHSYIPKAQQQLRFREAEAPDERPFVVTNGIAVACDVKLTLLQAFVDTPPQTASAPQTATPIAALEAMARTVAAPPPRADFAGFTQVFGRTPAKPPEILDRNVLYYSRDIELLCIVLPSFAVGSPDKWPAKLFECRSAYDLHTSTEDSASPVLRTPSGYTEDFDQLCYVVMLDDPTTAPADRVIDICTNAAFEAAYDTVRSENDGTRRVKMHGVTLRVYPLQKMAYSSSEWPTWLQTRRDVKAASGDFCYRSLRSDTSKGTCEAVGAYILRNITFSGITQLGQKPVPRHHWLCYSSGRIGLSSMAPQVIMKLFSTNKAYSGN